MIRSKNKTRVLLVIMSCVGLIAASCKSANYRSTGENKAVTGARSAVLATAPTITPAMGCVLNHVTLDPTSPTFLAGDNKGLSAQNDVDCFAWQSFVALNWPVDPGWPNSSDDAGQPDRAATAANWGTPPANPLSGPYNTTTWETYKSAPDIFDPSAFSNGSSPDPWGVQPQRPGSCTSASSSPRQRVLRAPNKFGARSRPSPVILDAIGEATLPATTDEAFGGWLTDQAKQQVWFERSTNRAEFEYIADPANQLWTAAGQRTVATNNDKGISLPVGEPPNGHVQTWENLGAIEVKAAWRVLTNQSPAELRRYHLTKALILDESTGDCTSEILGLVGLHIIRKTKSFPNFMWATFEHVDNVPGDQFAAAHPYGFSFNDPSCSATNCLVNVPRIDGDGKALFPTTEPVQTARAQPIPTVVAKLNLAMQKKIAAENADSVFQYYQMVNVLWPKSSSGPHTARNRLPPLEVSSMTSAGPNTPVANTTLETYIQKYTCTDCHQSAHVAVESASIDACKSPARAPCYASDYSFLFQMAPTE